MRIAQAALSVFLFGSANGFVPKAPFGVKHVALQMAASSEKEVRDAIAGMNQQNFQETLSDIESFLRDDASAEFYARAKMRITDKAWALGLTIPEDYAKSAATSPAPAAAAPVPAPETEPEPEPVPEPIPESVAEEKTPEPEPEPVAAEPVAEAPAAPEEAKKITPALIKELRELTGAGMMDCKKALTETNGNVDEAIENMRKSGALKAAKKATKVAAEGQIIIKEKDGVAAMVEVNCQTDFVAKDATFLTFANEVADAAAEGKLTVEDLQKQFEDKRVALVAKIGENINIRRVQYVEGGKVATYLHNGGKIGVVVTGDGEDEVLKNMCMHVCASSPQFLSPDDVPEDVVEKERKVQIEIAMNEGKPQEIAEKMVNGRMKKYTGEVSLMGQPFVMEPKKSVGDVLKEKGASVANFVRLEVGEGIEKNEGPSFAEEVAAMAGKKEEKVPDPTLAPEPIAEEKAPEPKPKPVTAEPVAEAPAAPKEAKKITPALIKELRELTGAGMMDCKKALTETNGNVDEAIENMRKSGALKAAKKATKVAAEGQIIIKEKDGVAAMVEVNCQTDFVAKDATFLTFANEVADAAAEGKLTVEDLQKQFEDKRVALVAKIGENINIRRVQYVEGGKVATYLHNGGKIGVVVTGDGEDEVLKNMCMHVCASSPQFLSPDDVPEDVVEKERKVQIEIAMNEGKPQEIAEKMVNGRMKKYTGEVSLMGQPFVMEPKKSVGDVLKEKGASVANFVRLEVGEGIEKVEEPSFADEVAAMAGAR
jgi:elongation factor Ts